MSISLKFKLGVFSLFLVVFLADGFLHSASYLEELEEAFAAKLNEKTSSKKRRRRQKSWNEDIEESAGKLLRGEDSKIGELAAKDIKSMCESPYLDFLSSSELATWPEIKNRFNQTKKATELFELKYKTELDSAGSVQSITTKSATTIGLLPKKVATASKPIMSKPLLQIPGVKMPAMPGVKMPAMPGAKMPVTLGMSVPVFSDEGDEEVEEGESVDGIGSLTIPTSPMKIAAPLAPKIPTPPMKMAAPLAPRIPTPPIKMAAPLAPKIPTSPIKIAAPLAPKIPTPPIKMAAPLAPKIPTSPIKMSAPLAKPVAPVGGMPLA
jgi:hypothetical protein